MCGITGAVWTAPDKAIDAAQLEAMVSALQHRGPDDQGSWTCDYHLRPPYEAQPGVALGFRRLAIIDLETGNQPIANEDESVIAVFNGEIYNYPALRHRLEGNGHRLATQGDSETIVHLYEDEELDAFEHLNGMFAIAVWDARHRRLVLARDRLGQKPLYYRREPGRILFASELKSLLQLEGMPRDIDPNAIDEYLTYQYVPHPLTVFRGFHKLAPGHLAVFQDDRLEVKRYWNVDWSFERPWPRREAAERLEELLDSSVRMRMQSDVPLGAFLSGGVDSSLIVALMQRHADRPVKTFSIGFPVAEFDEREHARRVAGHLGTEHHDLEVTPDAVAILPRLVWHFDEPFADSSAIPTWYVSEFTRRQVTVALSGDGGDELFSGYARYRAVWLASQLDRSRLARRLVASRLWQWLPAGARQKSRLRQFRRFSEALRLPAGRRYLDWISIFGESQRALLYRDEFLEQLDDSDPYQFLGRVFRQVGKRDAVTAAGLADLQTYLAGDLMTKVDLASMAHSLEVRQPFLDYRLVEFAAQLPLRWRFRRGRGKRLLRDTFGSLLPASTWKRPKMGFGVPLDHWFRHELREMTHDMLLGADSRLAEYFRREFIQQLVEEHEGRVKDHSARLWALLVLEWWLREWMLTRPLDTAHLSAPT